MVHGFCSTIFQFYFTPMKKALIVFATIVFALQMQAQDASLLEQIKTANSKITSFEADLSNSLVKSRKTKSQTGTIHYAKPYEFAAQFTTGNYMIVNEKKIKMDMGIFHGTFKLKDGGRMQSLANIFLYGFQGRIQDLADENNYNLSTKTENNYHVVTGTIKKKKLIGIGYKTVVFKFQTSDLLLKEIELYDYSDNKDIYTISNVKYNVTVDKKRFQF